MTHVYRRLAGFHQLKLQVDRRFKAHKGLTKTQMHPHLLVADDTAAVFQAPQVPGHGGGSTNCPCLP